MMIQMKGHIFRNQRHYCGASPYATHGERVVKGQKLIQNTADDAVGLVELYGRDGRPRDYYVRQLWNGKGSIDIDNLNASGLSLSHHVRMGRCDPRPHRRFDCDRQIHSAKSESDCAHAISFMVSQAEQNDEDYAVFKSSWLIRPRL